MPTSPRGNYIFSYIKDVSFPVKADSNRIPECSAVMESSYFLEERMINNAVNNCHYVWPGQRAHSAQTNKYIFLLNATFLAKLTLIAEEKVKCT